MSDSIKIIYVDTETTDILDDREVIQLAVLEDRGGDILTYNGYFLPKKPISTEASSIHNLTEKRLKRVICESDSVRVLQFLKMYYNLTGDEIYLVGHNVIFDIEALSNTFNILPSNNIKIIDTLKVVKSIYTELNSYSLQYLRYALNLDDEEAELQIVGRNVPPHDALGDAIYTKFLTDHFISMGYSYNQLWELSSKKEVLNKLPFGKYRGAWISDIFLSDPDYLNWLLKQNIDEGLRKGIERVGSGGAA